MATTNLTTPIFFNRNRVFRVYLGGELYRDLLGDTDGDGFYPEEWVASSVKAMNAGHTDPLEGISITEDGIPFSQLLADHPVECLGNRSDLGVLVKFLDSAIRLPMQVHPTREFSKQYFGSPYGKAESWLILATRPDACIYFGFKDQITAEEFNAAVEENKTNPDSMTKLVMRIPVKEGDVFFVPAGMIHAIGAGCLLLEVQEPTDFTIQPEYRCGDYMLNEHEMYLGLDPDIANTCFDLTLYGQKALELGVCPPVLISNENGVEVHELIGKKQTNCFTMVRHRCHNATAKLDAPATIVVVTKGQGVVEGPDGYSRNIQRGNYFFVPAAAKDLQITGDIEFVCCAGAE